MITKEDINRLRDDTNLVDFIQNEDDITLARAGSTGFKGLCPLPGHREKTPSFTVNPDTNRYMCFGCGENGDIFDYLRETRGMSFVEACELLATRAGVTLKRVDTRQKRTEAPLAEINAAARDFFVAQRNDKVTEFMQERGLNEEYLRDEWEVGYAPNNKLIPHLESLGYKVNDIVEAGLARKTDTGRVFEFFRGRMMWTIYDHLNRPAGFGARKLWENDPLPGKFINTPATDLYKKSSVLFGLSKSRQAIRKDRIVILAEGYTDVVSFHLADLPYAVAPCGTSFTEEHMKRIARILGPTGEFVICMDGDAAGIKSMAKVLEIASEYPITLSGVLLPDGADPDSYRIEHGTDALRERFQERQPLIKTLLEQVIASHDLSSPDEVAQVTTESVELLGRVKNRVLAEKYSQWLSERLKVSSDAIEELLPEQIEKTRYSAEPQVLNRPLEYDLLRIAYQVPQAFLEYRDRIVEEQHIFTNEDVAAAVDELAWLDDDLEDSVWREEIIGTLPPELVTKMKSGLPPTIVTIPTSARQYLAQVLERLEEDAVKAEEGATFRKQVFGASNTADGILKALEALTAKETHDRA